MAILTVTARGQVTFRKDVLRHPGVEPGGKVELELLPDGRGRLRAAKPAGTIDGFIGLLAGRMQKVKITADTSGQKSKPDGAVISGQCLSPRPWEAARPFRRTGHGADRNFRAKCRRGRNSSAGHSACHKHAQK